MAEDLGSNIKFLRRSQGYSISELARLARVAKGYLHGIENGINKNPGLDLLSRIADVLKCDINTLTGNTEYNLSVEGIEIGRAWDEGNYSQILHMIAQRLG